MNGREPGTYIELDAEWNDAGWTRVPNSVVRCQTISRGAKGMVVELASHVVGRRLTLDEMIAMSTDGRDATRARIVELERAGFLTRYRERDSHGRLGVAVYRLHVQPQTCRSEPKPDFPTLAEPTLAGPTSAKPDTSSTKTRTALEDQTAEDQKSTSPDVADAPPHDDREQPSLPDTSSVKAAVQDLGTGPEREADPTVLDKPSADDLAAGPATAPARLDVKALCDRLADGMVANDCLRPTITQGWRDAARLLIDKDGRELGKALALIDWCQADEFWRGNIKSMGRFRAQYDTLRLRALGEWERGKGRGGGHVPFQCPDESAYDEPLRVRA